MEANYKPGTLLPNTSTYDERDYVTIIVRYWMVALLITQTFFRWKILNM